jgi:glycosyltransferase involved in cell wall biosynthesis
MRIAQVAPLDESVPPKLYGGTERVVSYLADELVRQGHAVTLFASADSHTSARLIPSWPGALRLAGNCRDPVSPHFVMVEDVLQRASEFDVIHFHIAPLHFPATRRLRVPHITTLHGRLDLAELAPLFREFGDVPVVSISDAQRVPVPYARWAGTVHHGLPPDALQFHPDSGSYLAFLGRISPEKRVDRAVAIAQGCGLPLRIAAKVDVADAEYFVRDIEPLLRQPGIEFVGEISEADKNRFLGGARALLFPIDWPEPFGLVMIEALACGTPVVAFRGGSVDEVIDHGVTGFVVNDVPSAIEATRCVTLLDRRACRKAFERRFVASRMVDGYLDLYQQAIDLAASDLVA